MHHTRMASEIRLPSGTLLFLWRQGLSRVKLLSRLSANPDAQAE